MKKHIFVFLTLALPLVILAMPASGRRIFGDHPLSGASLRAFRLHEVQSSYFENTWIPSAREVLYYNQQHPAKLDSLEMYFYNQGEQNWQKHSVATYQTNAAGRTIASWYYDYWQGSYTLRERAEYTYDASNRLILEKWYNCDGPSDVLRYRENYFYNSNQLAEFISWEYDPWDQETEYYRNVFQNDPQGRPTEVLSYYSPDSLNWETTNKEECTYQPNDTSTGLTFIEYFSELMYEYGYLYSYVHPWMWDTFTVSYWSSRAWQYESRDAYSYLIPSLQLNSVVSYSWDGDWIPDSQDTFTYNNDANLNWVISWYYDAGNWLEASRNQYTWETYIGNNDNTVPSPSQLSLKAYPLPFAEAISILPLSPKSAEITLSIYNLKGQLLRRIKAKPGIATSWDGLDSAGKSCPSGIYFIKAGQGNTQTSLRIIKLQ